MIGAAILLTGPGNGRFLGASHWNFGAANTFGHHGSAIVESRFTAQRLRMALSRKLCRSAVDRSLGMDHPRAAQEP